MKNITKPPIRALGIILMAIVVFRDKGPNRKYGCTNLGSAGWLYNL